MSDDLISRQAAIDFIKDHSYPVRYDGNSIEQGMTVTGIEQALNEMPSIQPKQKTGRWIYTNTIGGMRYYGCTICTNQEKDCIADENEIQWYNYCPNCGAKMESDKNDN